jgi:adenosylcobyric acid synthase
VKGYIINKFRGDVSLFDDGLKAIEQFTGWHCFGVVPWLKEAALLPPEDSVILERKLRGTTGKAKIVVLVLDRIANFDDFDPLASEPEVDLIFLRNGEAIPRDAKLVILPGSKATITDLKQLRSFGWDRQLQEFANQGGKVLGICGGFQMLGRIVNDPLGLEGAPQSVEGIGLLDVVTVMEREKTVRNTYAISARYALPIQGYEIHLGLTSGDDTLRPFSTIDGRAEGAVTANGHIMGTYLHGLFDGGAFRQRFLHDIGMAAGDLDYRLSVEAALDAIALRLECLGLAQLFNIEVK